MLRRTLAQAGLVCQPPAEHEGQQEPSGKDASAVQPHQGPRPSVWSGAVPASLRQEAFTLLGAFLPQGRAAELQLHVRSAGVASLPHFSMDHHTVVQLAGTQRVMLLPPPAHRRLRPFPKLHPFSHHSSLPPTHPAVHALLAAHGQAIILHPGDTLYIPPFWWSWTDGESAAKRPTSSGGSGGAVQRAGASVWLSTHSADDAVGGVLLPLYSRQYAFERLRRRLGRLFAFRLL